MKYQHVVLFSICFLFFTTSAFNNLFFFPNEMKKINQNIKHIEKMNPTKLKKVHPIIWFNSLMGVGLDAKLENIETPSYFCYKNYPW